MRTPARKVAPKSPGLKKTKKSPPMHTDSPRSRTPNTRASKGTASIEKSVRSALFEDDENRSSVKSRGKNKMEEYPVLTRFCYTAEELHEVYGLSMEGKLPKDLTDDDIPNDQWLTVFKQKQQKNAKIFLSHLRSTMVDDCRDDCRLLFHKVYQGCLPSKQEKNKEA